MHPIDPVTNQPKRQDYPKHMYNGKFRKMAHGGDDEPIFLVVNSKEEEAAAKKKGWKLECPVLRSPKPAIPDAAEYGVEANEEPAN